MTARITTASYRVMPARVTTARVMIARVIVMIAGLRPRAGCCAAGTWVPAVEKQAIAVAVKGCRRCKGILGSCPPPSLATPPTPPLMIS